MSNHLAKLLGGNLTATSNKGHGSTFVVTLLLNETSINEETSYINEDTDCFAESESVIPEQMSGNVLVADDEAMNQELIAMYLEDIGDTVTFADNGEHAVEKALKSNFDPIFIDMQMPILSGIDAVKKLRKENYLGPITMFSANVTVEDIEI